MKTITTLKQNIEKSILVILLVTASLFTNANASVNSALPKNPVVFTAVLTENNKVDFKWSTEKETNLSHFIVEKSTDGINFSDAALVFAFGNTNAKSEYTFTINNNIKKAGTVYFRLSAVNENGTIEYSETTLIKIGK